ncbi:TetR/AcrR family transcriptional regulator [Streptomyces polyrhachis]|uniref:TetR/AcrR family transcriptional regulator n=1 Tax=Streptomyces polyrhachis TaxID=1282885 RepID=A0ABW2GL50_9ACTN
MTSSPADGPTTPGQKPAPPRRARSGRRAGDSGTKDQILASALRLFADHGFARTTIRAIAEDAQVDPALVHHYFANKEGVFNAAINSSLSVSSVFDTMAQSAHQTGNVDADWIARSYFSFWENETTRYAMTAIYRAGLADSSTTAVLRARVEESIKKWASYTDYQSLPGAETRAALASGHLAGLAIMRYLLKIHPLSTMDFDEFVSWVVPALELRLSPTLEPRSGIS